MNSFDMMIKRGLGKAKSNNKIYNNFMGDFDRDGVKNILDCKRFNSKFHGGLKPMVGTKEYTDYKNKKPKYLYHGTKAKYLPSILNVGLIPQPISSEELKRLKKNREAIFLTPNIEEARYYSKIGHATKAYEQSIPRKEKVLKEQNFDVDKNYFTEGDYEEHNKQREELGFDKYGVHKDFYDTSEPVILKINTKDVSAKREFTSAFAPSRFYTQDKIEPNKIKVIKEQ